MNHVEMRTANASTGHSKTEWFLRRRERQSLSKNIQTHQSKKAENGLQSNDYEKETNSINSIEETGHEK